MPIVLRERFVVEEHLYTDFIRRYHGSILLHVNKFHEGIGVVGPAINTNESRWSTVTIENNIGRSIELITNLEALWIYGYRRSTHGYNPWRLVSGENYDAFSSHLGQYECLGFHGNYPAGTTSINVSRYSLNHAITVLDNYAKELNQNCRPSNTDKAKRCFIILVLYFAEALRILPIRDLLCDEFSQSERVFVDMDKMNLAQNWQRISSIFLDGSYPKAFVDKFKMHNSNEVKEHLWLAYTKTKRLSQNLGNVRKNSGPGDPGNGDDSEPDDNDMGGSSDGGPKSSGDRARSKNYMGGNQPRDLVAGSSSRCRTIGRRRSGDLLHLHDVSASHSTLNQGHVTLSGPKRSIPVEDKIDIFVWFFHHAVFTMHRTQTRLWEDESDYMNGVICRSIECFDRKFLDVSFAVYHDAVEAHLNVYFVDFDYEGEDALIPVHGTVRASNSFLTDSKAQSILFHKLSKECVSLKPGKVVPLPLSRRVTAVPRQSSLLVHVSIDVGIEPDNLLVIEETVKFNPSLGSTEMSIILPNGGRGKVLLMVSWVDCQTLDGDGHDHLIKEEDIASQVANFIDAHAGERDPWPQRSNVMDCFRDFKVPRVEYQTDVHTRFPPVEASQSVMVDQQQLQMPRALMEVFSVKFLEFNQHDFDQMYGCILMNLCPSYVVFSRKQGGPLNITPEGFVKLRGPNTAMEECSPNISQEKKSRCGVARGCGWQNICLIINLGAYYLVGIPSAVVFAFFLHFGGQGLWLGIICAMIVQLIVLIWIIVRTDWHHETMVSQRRVQKSQGNTESAQQEALNLP